jgi:Flp pilus assembly protein TadD
MAAMSARAVAKSGPEKDRRGAELVPGYRLLRRVGSGGAGDVWCAEAPGGLRVALKIVRLAGGLGRRELANLRILRAIRHPNLLAYFGAWRARGRLIIGMELADRSLWDRFAEARGQGLAGIPLGELLEVMGEVARVLDFLNEPCHELDGRSGVAIHHRDIKPQNIMLIGRGVKVADFGLSCLDGPAGASRSQCGLTFGYAAPETFRRQVAATSDQYSLAVTYCQMRGGRLPFAGPPAAVMMGHLSGDPDLSMLPEPERPVVGRAMAKEPSGRWTDCRSFVEALAGCARAGVPDSLPGPADAPGSPEGSSGSVEIPAFSGAWDGSASASLTDTAGIGDAAEPSAYCLDLPVPAEDVMAGGAADSSEPTVVAGIASLDRPGRPAPRVLLAAASVLVAGLAVWSWSARPASRAAVPPRVRSIEPGSADGAASSRGQPGPLVEGGSVPRPAPASSAPAGTSSRRRFVPMPPAPPIPARALASRTLTPARTTAPVALRLPDLSAWSARVRKATSLARTWLANLQPAGPPSPAPPPAAPARPPQPAPPPESRVAMPDVLAVEAGRNVTIPIQVNRTGDGEPLAVHFEGLPAGVTIADVTIPAGRERAEVLVHARLDAPAATAPVAMTLGAGAARARVPFRLEVRANPAMLHRTRGHTLLACGRPAEAVAAFSEALKAGVADPYVYNNRALAYAALNQLDLAIRDYTDAVRLKPEDPTMHYNRGVAFARRGDAFRALLDLDTAIRMKPDYVFAYQARAEVYRKQGDMVRSCADSGRASELARAARPEGRPPAPHPPQVHATSGPGDARPEGDPAALTR